MNTSQGPRPISLFQAASHVEECIPTEVATILHCLAIGFPVVGESFYNSNEKFFNPTVPPPSDDFPVMLHPWLGRDGTILTEPRALTDHIVDFGNGALLPQPRLNKILDDDAFDAENSTCRYIDHPESVHIRRDRGRPTPMY